jgi:hypothetical protein
MWLIVQQNEAATGEAHSVREFVEKAFAHVGRTIVWKGSGVEDKGIDRDSGNVIVERARRIGRSLSARSARPTRTAPLPTRQMAGEERSEVVVRGRATARVPARR